MENHEALEIIYKYSALFVDGNNGISASGISHVLEVENVSEADKSMITRKITAYVVSALKTQQKQEQSKEKQKQTKEKLNANK